MDFKLISPYRPTGDQPEAIDELSRGILDGTPYQTLLGVTGSGKTFTMANVIERVQKPTLILSHNKTLAAQLYNEFKSFFPENAVEYFVSYYDYYQPEAYIPSTDTYIEKDLAINEEIDRLRLSTTSALLSGRKDVIVVSSVSCLYGIGNPEDFHSNVIDIKVGDNIGRNRLLRHFVDSLYSRNEIELSRGNFRVKGDTVDIYLAKLDINCNYIHSDVDTLDRIKILDDLRAGVYDVLIGVNLLREGLDLPEVSLVAILDADKEGFLRSHRSLTQTVGRAARNLNGRVIMYADRITESMQKTIDETNRRREKQLAYNEENHITPQAIQKSKSSVLISNADTKQQAQPSKATKPTKAYSDEYREHVDIAADPIVKYMSKEQLQKAIERTRKQMVEAAKKMDFIEAAQYRDELIKLEDLYQKTTTTT